MPYVLWIAAYNTSFLLGYLILDTVFFHVPEPDKFPYNVKKRKSSSASRTGVPRDTSPVRRSDRGPHASPTEAAVAAASSSSYPGSPILSADLDDQTLPTPSSQSPGNRLKRSTSKRAAYGEGRAGTYSSDPTPSYSYPNQTYGDFDQPVQSVSQTRRAPELLEAINKNGLSIFLLVSDSSFSPFGAVVHLH